MVYPTSLVNLAAGMARRRASDGAGGRAGGRGRNQTDSNRVKYVGGMGRLRGGGRGESSERCLRAAAEGFSMPPVTTLLELRLECARLANNCV